MLSDKKRDTVQIPMDSSKPAQTPRAHDPRWVYTYTHMDWTDIRASEQQDYERNVSPFCLSVCMLALFGCGGLFSSAPCATNMLRPLPKPQITPPTLSLLCFLLSSSFSSPCSSGVTPLILIYLMKCLKPPCGNPSTPIKRTLVLWLLRRQGHILSFLTPVIWKYSRCTLWSLASFVLGNCCSDLWLQV